MGRKANLIPSVMLNVALPKTAHDQLTEHLYSPLEGRVPLGSYQAFIGARIREFFTEQSLDLATVVPGLQPTVRVVRGSPEAIAQLRQLLGVTS
jgi:hypothetical protein